MPINKTQRTAFEKDLQRAYRGNRRYYAKRVPDVTDMQILKEIRSGAAKVRKTLNNHADYMYDIEKFFEVPALEARRKRKAKAQDTADKKNRGYELAYYKACDKLANTESHVDAAKIVADFKAINKQD